MAAFLAYELVPQSHSLFKDDLIWKSVNRTLGVMLKSFTTQQSNRQENISFVVDGGHLLQQAPTIYIWWCMSVIYFIH